MITVENWRDHVIPWSERTGKCVEDHPYDPGDSIKIISVPNTGTRTLATILGCHTIHTFVGTERIREAIKGRVVACPLRDPQAVWKSWSKRRGTPHEINFGNWKPAWQTLREISEEADVHFIPMDHPAMSAQMEILADRLNATLSWDGKIIGHVEGEAESPPDLTWIYDMPFVRRFYDYL